MIMSRSALIDIWTSSEANKLLPVITNMTAIDLQGILDEFHENGCYRDMSITTYMLIIGELLRRLPAKEFGPHGLG